MGSWTSIGRWLARAAVGRRRGRNLHLWPGGGLCGALAVAYRHSGPSANYSPNDSALPGIAVADIVADYGTSNSPYNSPLGGGSGGAVLGI